MSDGLGASFMFGIAVTVAINLYLTDQITVEQIEDAVHACADKEGIRKVEMGLFNHDIYCNDGTTGTLLYGASKRLDPKAFWPTDDSVYTTRLVDSKKTEKVVFYIEAKDDDIEKQ